MAEPNLEGLEAEAASIAANGRPPIRQNIPIRFVENLNLPQVSAAAIRRTLQGHSVHAGAVTGIEWFLLDSDESTAIYAAKCPYEFCGGNGDLLASTRIDKHGKAELPFTDSGALQCQICDEAIEARYNAEAFKLANPRRSPGLITAENPKACECGQALPVGSSANKTLCQPCATARALERKRLAMAKSRAKCAAEA